jgi:hypothetical protein
MENPWTFLINAPNITCEEKEQIIGANYGKYFNKNVDIPQVFWYMREFYSTKFNKWIEQRVFSTRNYWYQKIYDLENKSDKLLWILKDPTINEDRMRELIGDIPEWLLNSILDSILKLQYQKMEYYEKVDQIIEFKKEILSSEFIDIVLSVD